MKPPPQRCPDAGQRYAAVRRTACGAYRITAKIGEDGMDEVYQAWDTSLEGDVAHVDRCCGAGLPACPEAAA